MLTNQSPPLAALFRFTSSIYNIIPIMIRASALKLSLPRLECSIHSLPSFSLHIQYLVQKPDIYRRVCSNRDMLDFSAEIHNILGTVYTSTWSLPRSMRSFLGQCIPSLYFKWTRRRFIFFLGQCMYT